MGDNQDDTFAVRRAELDGRFRMLPPIGTAGYWRSIEGADAWQVLPLEVLARCFRERNAAGAASDAERIFNVMWRRIQSSTQRWAWAIADQARSGMKPQLREDLEQECYMKLWEELADDGPTFLLEHFASAVSRLRQHVAHDVMERAGEWQRRGVKTPQRIPRSRTESLQAEPEGEDETPLVEQVADASAQDAFNRAELSDLLALVMTLPGDQRTIVLDRFWSGWSQDETAAKLGISDRMVRYRLKTILRELGVRYLGAGEDDHV
ncbi:MAG TPA: sigma-70 family RNA polymerase sigma factor [Ktedonobacterales bacterium]